MIRPESAEEYLLRLWPLSTHDAEVFRKEFNVSMLQAFSLPFFLLVQGKEIAALVEDEKFSLKTTLDHLCKCKQMRSPSAFPWSD